MVKRNFWLRMVIMLLALTGMINILFNQTEVGLIIIFLSLVVLWINVMLNAKDRRSTNK